MTRTRKRSNLQPGSLLTRQERLQLRLLREDLQRQIDRCDDELRRARLESQIAGVERERIEDRRTRPRRTKAGR